MAKTLIELLNLASEIRDADQEGENTADRVGSLLVDIIEFINENGKVVNDLVTGGEGDALSAEMGKKIRQNITIMLNRLGNYAFPNGKPTLDWSNGGSPTPVETASVSQTIGEHVTSSSEVESVELGGSFTTTLGTDDDLFAIDVDNLVITMDGDNIKSTAYDPATGVVSIDGVTGDIVIDASAITYYDGDGESNKLAFFLDCKRRGGVTDHWVDIIGEKDFALTNVTQADTGMVFNGSNSKAEYSGGSLAIPHGEGTIEFVIGPKDSVVNGDMVLWNGYDGGIGAGYWNYNGNVGCAPVFNLSEQSGSKFVSCSKEAACNSISAARALIDGVSVSPTVNAAVRWVLTNGTNTGKMYIGSRYKSSGWVYCSMTIKAIRVYNTQLTSEQARQNYLVDKKRYNIS